MLHLTFAAELTHKGLWYPTILGVLVVVVGFALFCGSVYLLLGTNLGARLGFLVVFTAFFGFMSILATLWVTTASPLNTLKGRIPGWKVEQVVTTLDESKYPEARTIEEKGHKVSATEESNVKAAVDEVLVTKTATPTAPLEPDANKFAEFDAVTDYMAVTAYEVGGSNPRFYKLQFTHKPLFAVLQYCEVQPAPAGRSFALPPLTPTCSSDPDAKTGYVVLLRDLGNLRLPPTIALFSSLLLFGLGLLSLHWREKDEMELERLKAEAASGPKPVPAKV